MVNGTGSEEASLPISERITPKSPVSQGGEPRSQIYSADKLANDYVLFMEGQQGYDPAKPLVDKQRDLFRLYERGEVKDAIQAWEWMLARKWDEFDPEEKGLVKANLKPDELLQYGHLLTGAIKFDPDRNKLHGWPWPFRRGK